MTLLDGTGTTWTLDVPRGPPWAKWVAIAVAVLLLVFGVRYLMADSARIADARAWEERARASESDVAAALERFEDADVARQEAADEGERLRVALDESRASEAKVREESDARLLELEEDIRRLSSARVQSSSSLRLSIPEAIRPAFDDHEAIHAAELAAERFSHDQTKRKLRASEVLHVDKDDRILGLEAEISAADFKTFEAEGVIAEQAVTIDLWKETAGRYEKAATAGLLSRIWRDAGGYAGAVLTGYAAAKAL